MKPFAPPQEGWAGTALPQDTSAPVSGLYPGCWWHHENKP